jgi:2-polyprenyl-3-methyl-5-hydroxy-6-metoxy-1,4-benzoquinol methylase
MTATFDEVLCCPVCRSARPVRSNGAYACPSCERRFPILGGIPRLLEEVPEDSRQVQRVFDFEHRRFRDSWHTRFEPRLVEQFLDQCGLPREFFPGLRALDAGCGSGRWSYALAELGADVVAFDLTEGGIEVASEHLGSRENVSVCQANVFQPPFAPSSFDFVVSWGVLHHTPDTRAAFRELVPLVRPGGTFYVMVYERRTPVMFAGTNALRWFMRRLPDEKRYRACRRLVIKSPLLSWLLGRFLMVAHYDPASGIDEKTLQFGLFDAYSPRYNHLHTRGEVRTWFEESGFTDVVVLDRPTGSVHARGRRLD